MSVWTSFISCVLYTQGICFKPIHLYMDGKWAYEQFWGLSRALPSSMDVEWIWTRDSTVHYTNWSYRLFYSCFCVIMLHVLLQISVTNTMQQKPSADQLITEVPYYHVVKPMTTKWLADYIWWCWHCWVSESVCFNDCLHLSEWDAVTCCFPE